MPCRTALRAVGCLGITICLLASSAAEARTAAPSGEDGLGACQRAVSRIGAQMSHQRSVSPDGQETIQFVLRGEGGDYTVSCNARTGSIGAAVPVLRSTLDAAPSAGR